MKVNQFNLTKNYPVEMPKGRIYRWFSNILYWFLYGIVLVLAYIVPLLLFATQDGVSLGAITSMRWPIILALIMTLVFGGLIFYLFRISVGRDINRYLKLGPSRVSYNSDFKSLNYTLRVIRKSEKWLIMYDYGEKAENNIYSSESVKSELVKKLQNSDKDFRIVLIFKNKAKVVKDLPLYKSIVKLPSEVKDKITIYTNVNRKDDEEYKEFNKSCMNTPHHYKINDGLYAYLTQHRSLETKRQYTYTTPWTGITQKVKDSLSFHNAVVQNRKPLPIS